MILTPGQLSRRAELYHQLGSMIAAGIPLIQALEMCSKNSALRTSRKNILAILDHLKNGLSFSDSMVKEHGWMPEFDVALLSAGEHSGRLDSTFKLLGEYYSSRAMIIRDTISSLLLPAANLHVFLLVFPLGLLIAFARGIFFGDYSLCVPFIVEKIIVFSLIYGVILFFIFATQGNRGERWRSVLESVWRFFPRLRTALKYLVLSRLAAALGALTSSGVSIIKSWPLAATASGSPYLKRQVSTWDSHLEQGATPAELVSSTPYFPEMFNNLYHTGEISGKLDESLDRLHAYYREEGHRALHMFSKISSGIIYGTIAAMIAYNVIKFYMALYGGISSGNFGGLNGN